VPAAINVPAKAALVNWLLVEYPGRC